MAGRHAGQAIGGRTLAGPLGLAALTLAAGVAAAALASAGSAQAATAPTPSYHAGVDDATFTATGVLDGNCLVSVGGTEIFIKPGDRIRFSSSLVGVSVGQAVAGTTLGGLLNSLLQPSQVAGLDVRATIGRGAARQTVIVAGGQSSTYPARRQPALTKGNHRITWTATGLALVPGLTKTSIPLSSDALQSGAKLSWTGVIHVTNSAPTCKVAVATPRTRIKVGPVQVTVPPVGATVPGVTLPTSLPALPSLPNLLPGPSTQPTVSTGGRTSSGATDAGRYRLPALSVPDQVVPKGDGTYSGGSGLGVSSGTGGGSVSGIGSGGGGSGGGATGGTSTAGTSAGRGGSRPIDLASSPTGTPSGQLPVVLAILGVIALAIVAGTYARLFLLGRKS